jgi:hypothetical protein
MDLAGFIGRCVLQVSIKNFEIDKWSFLNFLLSIYICAFTV